MCAIRNRLVIITLVEIGRATLTVGFCVVRVELDYVCVIRNRLVVVTLAEIGNAAIIVGIRTCAALVRRWGRK